MGTGFKIRPEHLSFISFYYFLCECVGEVWSIFIGPLQKDRHHTANLLYYDR